MAGGLFKRQNRNGKPLPRWYLWWLDADGRKRQKAAYTDREASEDMLRQFESEAARMQQGLVDPYADHRKAPLSSHLEDFLAHLRSGRRATKYVNGMETKLKRALRGMDARLPKDLTTDRAERYLLCLVEDDLSHKTRNDYLGALVQFADWGVKRGRWESNPFKVIPKLNTDVDVRRERRALTEAELARLLHAAETRGVANFRAQCPNAKPESLAKIARRGAERRLI